jgi:acetyl/propionyl-CoA carboxylase alpha subunit/acetyl-CoA carboxylase carboxyltransferase component
LSVKEEPIRRLAIVNRGEAAMRCIRAVKSLSALEREPILAIALYTDVDRDAPFVRHADVAVELPVRTTPVAAYLDHELLVSTLRAVRADAVWPGWGFVAEDPRFVDALTAAGIRFLGPTSETMRRLGDKIASKLLAETVGVPVSPWSNGELADEADAAKHAARVGYPLVVKASAGGGGRGIRVVESADKLAEGFRSARAEAIGAFNDGRLFLEKMVQGGRHIEVQIVADAHGNVHALGTRDCSVQRRHQKVIEEAPPVGLPEELIAKLKASAVSLASKVGYRGAGTVEFLVRAPDYFFLEINPRLQVEHGITEELTGTDLVELQIRIARGEKLPSFGWERGYAIEARVCAEDPDAGFLPAPGKIVRFDPALGPKLRIDTGVASESRVPAAFDSLIAKVIARGDTREEARARLVCALRDFDLTIEGGATNKGYLLELLEAEDYRKGGVDTRWLDRWNETRGENTELAAEALLLAAILSYQRLRHAQMLNFYADPGNVTPAKIPPSVGLPIDLSHRGEQYKLRVYASGSRRYRVHLDGKVVSGRLSVSGSNAARLITGDRDLRVLWDMTDSHIRVEIEGRVHKFGRQTAGQVRSGTPSMVVAVHVAVGDKVSLGQSLGLLEAMKMEISFEAPVSGVVTEVLVRKGQQLSAGDLMLVIAPERLSGDALQPTARLALPTQTDPLTIFFKLDEDGGISVPDLESTAKAKMADRAHAMRGIADDIRRVMLGYDVNPERVEKLIALMDAPLPEGAPSDFLSQLAEVHKHLPAFADMECLFARAQATLPSGELDSSNSAKLRMYLRRMQAEGEGLPPEFLEVLRRVVEQYNDGVRGLEYNDGLRRAVLRLFSTQIDSGVRFRLMAALIRRVSELTRAGVNLESHTELRGALERLADLRGQLPDTISDAALEASYMIFLRPELNIATERTSQRLEAWLASAETSTSTSEPPEPVLRDLAVTPPRLFKRVEPWLWEGDSRRRAIALGAFVRRIYAPRVVTSARAIITNGHRVEALTLDDGRVVLTVLAELSVAEPALRALFASAGDRRVDAFELVLAKARFDARATDFERLRASMAQLPASGRLSISFVDPARGTWYETIMFGGAEAEPLHGLHPEAAQRVDFYRYREFELERLPAADGIYCFSGVSRKVAEDRRMFVLADVRFRPPESAPDSRLFVPIFEREFYEATRTLRLALAARDPDRQLQWNRINVFIAHPLKLDQELAEKLAQELRRSTHQLGLERVMVRVKLAGPNGETAGETELLIWDSPGAGVTVRFREPHRAPLVTVSSFERAVVAAKRRGLIYPYALIRAVAPEQEQDGEELGGSSRYRLPRGHFEEFDLEPGSEPPVAVSVKGRAPGLGESAIVFGLMSTPTSKVPEGMKRVLVLSDPTRGMGALAKKECDRVVAAIDLAEKLRLPVEWLPISSGARIAIDSGTENLDATARVVRRIVSFTQAGGTIHLIVAGINVGAQSYWDALATMLMHTKGVLIMTPRASMVLTGRAALAASGSVSAEDEVAIGGYERVMGPNGQAQYFAADLPDAYRILYEHYEYTYVHPGERGPRRRESSDPIDRDVTEYPYATGAASEAFADIGELFDPDKNPGKKRPFSMRALMGAVIDQDGGRLERWQSQVGAETAIVWDSHLGGFPVCLIGIESQNVPRWGYRPLDGPAEWNGGTLFPQSSKKVARALNAASGNRPVVVLANLSGFDGSPESMRKLQLEYGAEIARAVVNFEGPLVFLVVSRYHGGAYVVFSRQLNPNLRALAVEGSYASVIGGGPAAAVVFGREVRARVSADPRLREMVSSLGPRASRQDREALTLLRHEVTLQKQSEMAAEFDAIHSVERAKRVGSLEAIVPAKGMRRALIDLLAESAGDAK